MNWLYPIIENYIMPISMLILIPTCTVVIVIIGFLFIYHIIKEVFYAPKS